jgi:general L-amino acid transport system permease protein
MDAEMIPTDAMGGDDLAPESPPLGAAKWMRENLFSTRFNAALTLVALAIVGFVVRNLVAWIFAPNRGWEAVATNLRFYMVQSYPASSPNLPPEFQVQFARVWVAVGSVIVLAALSLAAWRVGSKVAATKFLKTARAAGTVIALIAYLGPPTKHIHVLSGIDFPLIGPLLGFVGAFLGFLIEAALMTGGRLVIFLIGAAIAVGGHIAAGATKQRGDDLAFHSLWRVFGAGAFALLVMWVAPLGHYFFVGNGSVVLDTGQLCSGACFEPGTIATSTSGPWTLIFVIAVAAYFLARLGVRLVGGKPLRSILILFWTLSLPIIVLFVLRDPDFNLDRDGGGFDFIPATDVMIWVIFGIIGGLVIAALSLPRMGELGRVLGGLLVIGSLAMWAFPVLMRVRFIGLLFAIFAVGAQTFAGDRRARIRYVGLWIGLTTVLVILFAAINAESSVVVPGKTFLGGLMLTFVLALTSILLSFPIGLLMALGRTSSMPIFRVMSTIYIELVRGIPFITVLIFFDLILILFLPGNVSFDSVTLAIIAGTLFSAAYLAENVRGGLQAIPNGQYEAARAMGLSTLQLTVFIVLPQALRAVIPALVGQTIAIFKDTSLVAIIGLFDFLFIADKVIPAQTIFLGIKLENIVFIAAVYWMFTFSFSRASLRLEKKVGLGEY